MTRTRSTALEATYVVLALTGLVAVGAAAVQVSGQSFWNDLFANPATTTVTLDLALVGLAVIVFVVTEASRLGMRRPWIWVALAIPLPGAFVFPLFFVLRERRLAASRS
ncbi:MAG: DUF2834 domain-containing protein [Marmoricola sp.]